MSILYSQLMNTHKYSQLIIFGEYNQHEVFWRQIRGIIMEINQVKRSPFSLKDNSSCRIL
jgi:hypothetical protein